MALVLSKSFNLFSAHCMLNYVADLPLPVNIYVYFMPTYLHCFNYVVTINIFIFALLLRLLV